MNQGNIPKTVRDTLLKFDQTVEHLTEQATRTKEAIDLARERLTGGFERDQQYRDVRATLDKLVKDLPAIEDKRDAAERMLERCQAWLDELPDDVTLEPVKVKLDGGDLASVKERIRNATDELETLSKVPTPSADIEQRVRKYVAGLGRPKVSGVGDGDQLQVSWPRDDATSLFAILEPEKMTKVILAEVERAANDPLPLDGRRKRIVQLKAEIDTLQRQAFALGANDYATPPEIILGVKVRREAVKKAETRRNTRAALSA
jgi:hypothetical protein